MRAPVMPYAFLSALMAANTATHAADGRVIDQQVAAEPRGIVEVSNISGKVDISGWDRPEVSVHAELGGSVEGVDVKSDRGRTTITVKLPGFSFHGGSANLRINVPRGSELNVSAVSADIVSKDMSGVQRLHAVSGSIVAGVAQADVEAKTVSGDVVLHGNGQPMELHVTTISGDIEANTTSGDLRLQLDPARSVRVRTISGDVLLQGKLAKSADLDTQTVSGDVTLHAGAAAGYQYEVSTFSGGIENCFNVEAERTSRYGPGERLSGSRGDGSGHVRIKTMSGAVDLCDR